MREHEQFFGVESQRFAQPIDQRNRRPAAPVFNVRDVAGLDADAAPSSRCLTFASGAATVRSACPPFVTFTPF